MIHFIKTLNHILHDIEEENIELILRRTKLRSLTLLFV